LATPRAPFGSSPSHPRQRSGQAICYLIETFAETLIGNAILMHTGNRRSASLIISRELAAIRSARSQIRISECSNMRSTRRRPR
jgi:hypothetical protein